MSSHGPSTPPPIPLKGPVPRFVTSLPHPRVVSNTVFHTPIETIRQLKPVFLADRRQPAIPPQVSLKELLHTPAPSRQVFHPYSHLHRNPSTHEPFLITSKRTHPHPHPHPPPPSEQGPRLRFTSVPKFDSISHAPLVLPSLLLQDLGQYQVWSSDSSFGSSSLDSEMSRNWICIEGFWVST